MDWTTTFLKVDTYWCTKFTPPINTLLIVLVCFYVYFSNNNVSLGIPLLNSEHWVTYFMCSVSHFTNSHFFGNISSIIIFGTLLEIIHGSFASFIIFWYSATSGVLWFAAIENRVSLYRGASPGVYGIMGAYLAHTIINWKEAPFRFFWFFLLIFEVANILVVYYYSYEYRTSVAHSSHVFGFIQGVLIGIIVLKNVVVRKWEIILQIFSGILSFTLIILATTIIYIK